VIFSHWHPDHTLNATLFSNAQAHDVWGIYRNDQWVMRWAEGFEVSPGVRLIQTPGHTDQDIMTIAATDQGLVAFTHLWWTDTLPPEASPVDTDAETFAASRNPGATAVGNHNDGFRLQTNLSRALQRMLDGN